jgi:nitrous oxide reductase accessory protein NosL
MKRIEVASGTRQAPAKPPRTGARLTGRGAGRRCRRWLLAGMLMILGVAGSAPVDLPRPGPADTCPVCGMFVARYPEWIATVLYRDGHAHHFDGAKDLFKYLLDRPRWAPRHAAKEIASIGVTEYYGLTLIDARQAWYVIGSDVLGPMGHELVPLATQEDAAAFMDDHGGRRILRFDEVDLGLLDGLDQGRFGEAAGARRGIGSEASDTARTAAAGGLRQC